jgi:quercetin dioxygenase-like cupin family protein
MAIPHASSGEVVDVRPLGAALASTITRTLVKTDDLEVLRIVLPAGNELPPHRVPGEITVQCLEGNVAIRVGGADRELTAGTMVYVDGNVEHALRASEDSSLLVTILLKPKQ